VTRLIALVLFVALMLGQHLDPAVAQQRGPTWTETKCLRYKAAWGELVKQRGLAGLGQEFLNRHQAFIDTGCRASTHVCPRTDGELEVADMMVVAALNGGMASTFPPFSCKQ
jgi:hypothetical protein